MQRGILEGRREANCICMLLPTTPILSDTWGQDSYHYKEDLSESQWNDHLKEWYVKDTEKGQFNFTSGNYANELNSKQTT